MLEWETVIAALLVQGGNTATWAIRSVWKDWQRRRDQRHELARQEQEIRRQAVNQGIGAGYDISGADGFNMQAPINKAHRSGRMRHARVQRYGNNRHRQG